VLVTYGDETDHTVLSAMRTDEKVVLVANDEGLELSAYVASLPERIVQACSNMGTALVKTNQMVGNDIACDVADALRAAGVTTGLLARAGYWWADLTAFTHGAESIEAIRARHCEARLCRAADVVVATTTKIIQGMCAEYELQPARCEVIPNFVLDPVPVQERSSGTVLFAGQLIALKRVNVLIEAVAYLAHERGQPVQLEVVGAGPELHALRRLAQQLNAPVTFEKRIAHDQLLERMSRCAVYAQASETEGHPKTVLEAMASRAAVVVSEAPGIACVVEHGVTGLISPPTPQAFGEAIGLLLNDSTLRDRLGQTASNRILLAYGLRHIARQEHRVHQKAMRIARSHLSGVTP
jgi:glycosyltransferase involved in cell wall biosynthesis